MHCTILPCLRALMTPIAHRTQQSALLCFRVPPPCFPTSTHLNPSHFLLYHAFCLYSLSRSTPMPSCIALNTHFIPLSLRFLCVDPSKSEIRTPPPTRPFGFRAQPYKSRLIAHTHTRPLRSRFCVCVYLYEGYTQRSIYYSIVVRPCNAECSIIRPFSHTQTELLCMYIYAWCKIFDVPIVRSDK